VSLPFDRESTNFWCLFIPHILRRLFWPLNSLRLNLLISELSNICAIFCAGSVTAQFIESANFWSSNKWFIFCAGSMTAQFTQSTNFWTFRDWIRSSNIWPIFCAGSLTARTRLRVNDVSIESNSYEHKRSSRLQALCNLIYSSLFQNFHENNKNPIDVRWPSISILWPVQHLWACMVMWIECPSPLEMVNKCDCSSWYWTRSCSWILSSESSKACSWTLSSASCCRRRGVHRVKMTVFWMWPYPVWFGEMVMDMDTAMKMWWRYRYRHSSMSLDGVFGIVR